MPRSKIWDTALASYIISFDISGLMLLTCIKGNSRILIYRKLSGYSWIHGLVCYQWYWPLLWTMSLSIQPSLLSCKYCTIILRYERNPAEVHNEPRSLRITSRTGIVGGLNVSIDKFHHHDWRIDRADESTSSSICTRQSPCTHKLLG